MAKTTVLIIDDSALIRTLFKELISQAPDIEVIGTAVDVPDARAKIKALHPDVVTLDIEMPGMDGISFLEKIMTLRPMPVIMVSTLTQKGAAETIRALELGAFDYISKPVGAHIRDNLDQLRDELIQKIRSAVLANLHAAPLRAAPHAARQPITMPHASQDALIAIGSSTGGVEALRDIFAVLPGNLPPIVMAQHMPEAFTASFAGRLNALSQVEVAEARHGMEIKPGHAYLAPGGRHLRIVQKGSKRFCQLDESVAVSGHRPSVDVLFQSVAAFAKASTVGIILTGMGKDGATGLLAMRERGAYTIGQSAASCVVYGMPKAAMAAGAVAVELPLVSIAEHACHYLAQEGM